ncbi:MAG: hypothetical protein A2338_00890 [Bacteroidetes bacterium RIFOXYB12_FULL_41_6]|nr:MAG: hypothetical protein A2338_00890 [Bacteroidetes bacterium RIFOXYB12_FULL_41_6]
MRNMKKILSLFLFFGLTLSVLAQMSLLKPNPKYSKAVERKGGGDQELVPGSTDINPYTSNERGQDIVIGETFYDLQSNSTMAQRIWAFDDGTIGATWTRGMNAPNYADRGTGYNYFDGTSWGSIPAARIENVRTGWPSYAPYGANGELVCAHTFTSDGFVFSWRPNKGEGDWNYFTLIGPAGHEDISWPRLMTSGENNEIIHVIYVTKSTGNGGTPYEGLDGALLYSRSIDGGQTWDYEHVIIEGLTSDDIGFASADTYDWAKSKNGVIAFALNNGISDGLIFKSENDGESWEKITFFQSPYPLQDGTMPFDAYWASDGTSDLLFDDEGKIHVAFGRTYYSWNDAIYYSFGADGLIYWNEDKPVLDSTILGDPDALEAAGCLAAWVVQGPSPGDTVKGLTPYGTGMTSFPQLVFNRDVNNVPIVTIIYSSYDVRRVDVQGNTYRSIWNVSTEDGGATWSSFHNTTGDIFHLVSECVFPSAVISEVDNQIHILYQSDSYAGTSIQPDPPSHPPVLNSMVYLPINPLQVNVNETVGQAFEITQNFPNPFSGQTYVEVSLNIASNVSLEVYTLTGQKVVANSYGLKSIGNHTLKIDGSQLTTGVYFYTVTAGQNKVTHKMMVE